MTTNDQIPHPSYDRLARLRRIAAFVEGFDGVRLFRFADTDRPVYADAAEATHVMAETADLLVMLDDLAGTVAATIDLLADQGAYRKGEHWRIMQLIVENPTATHLVRVDGGEWSASTGDPWDAYNAAAAGDVVTVAPIVRGRQ